MVEADVHPSIHPPIYRPACLSISLSVYHLVCLNPTKSLLPTRHQIYLIPRRTLTIPSPLSSPIPQQFSPTTSPNSKLFIILRPRLLPLPPPFPRMVVNTPQSSKPHNSMANYHFPVPDCMTGAVELERKTCQQQCLVYLARKTLLSYARTRLFETKVRRKRRTKRQQGKCILFLVSASKKCGTDTMWLLCCFSARWCLEPLIETI